MGEEMFPCCAVQLYSYLLILVKESVWMIISKYNDDQWWKKYIQYV